MISNVPQLLKPLFVCMDVVKANDVIDFCSSPDLSHLNEDEQHVWGYHWNGLSLVIFPTQHVGVMEVTIFYDPNIKYLIIPPAEEVYPCSNTSPTLFHVLCMSSMFPMTQQTRNSNTTHTYLWEFVLRNTLHNMAKVI